MHKLGDIRMFERRLGVLEEVIEREQRVRLATAEGGLQLEERVTSAAGHPLHRRVQQRADAAREVRTTKELVRLLVLVARPLANHVCKVDRKLGLDVFA